MVPSLEVWRCIRVAKSWLLAGDGGLVRFHTIFVSLSLTSASVRASEYLLYSLHLSESKIRSAICSGVAVTTACDLTAGISAPYTSEP